MKDGLQFLRWNLQHYALALWGLRLRFDPPYPRLTRFFPGLIGEPVFEYRTYGLHAVWVGLLAAWFPLPVLTALVLGWGAISFDRSKYLKSNIAFWRQVLRENGVITHRAAGRLMECLLKEMERRMKQGGDWQQTAREAMELQDRVTGQKLTKDDLRRILAGA